MSKIYYLVRDIIANAKDIKKYATVRSEYLGTSFVREIFSSAKILLFPDFTVLCYPARPSIYHVLYKLAALSGIRLSTNIRRNHQHAVWTHNRTVQDPGELDDLKISKDKIINSGCVDTGKQTIGRLYREIFELDLDLDPLSHHGKMVKKSIVNGTNDAMIIDGPLRPGEVEEGFVYQKDIDNRNSEGLSVVYRVPIFDGSIPLVFIKYRTEAQRFRGYYSSVDVASASDLFSEDEQRKILLLAKRIGLEFGECDVLRDKDGKIYVIDLNNHPGGPPFRMNPSQKRNAGRILAGAFKRLFEQNTN